MIIMMRNIPAMWWWFLDVVVSKFEMENVVRKKTDGETRSMTHSFIPIRSGGAVPFKNEQEIIFKFILARKYWNQSINQ